MYQWKVNPLICCWVIKCSDFLLFTHLIRGNAGKAGFSIVYLLLRTWERSYFCVYVTIILMFIYGVVFVFFCLLLLPHRKREGPVCCSGWVTRLNPCQLGAKVAHAESPAGPPCQPKWNLHSTRCTHADKSNVYQLRKSNVYQSRKSNEFVAKKLDAAALGEILWSLFTFFSSNIGKSIILSAL